MNSLNSRPINDLDDVRTAMSVLQNIREAQIRIDMTIGPVEETYVLLNRFELFYDDGNSERVDGLAYGWKNLMAQVWLQTEMLSYITTHLYFAVIPKVSDAIRIVM